MIRARNLNHNLPGFNLRDISLDLNKGDYLTLLGPSGAGKSILLETLMGLITPDSGTIHINNLDATQLPPEQRGIAYLPQDLALFPHLSVRQNILFGAPDRKNMSAATMTWLNELLQLLNLEQLIDRRSVLNLSGGERQRVALARALLPKPKILFLDEPLSALDAFTKRQLQVKLREINRLLGVTILHVTHDREEAFMLGERIAVMIEGQIEQIGTRDELYYRPETLAAARFLLNQNIFRLEVADRDANNNLQLTGELPLTYPPDAQFNKGQKVIAGIRGEEVIIIRPDRSVPVWLQENRFMATVVDIYLKGGSHAVLTRMTDYPIDIEVEIPNCAFRDMNVNCGDQLDLCLKKQALWLLSEPEDQEISTC
jgi:ABC-type Fe3+/spermidine/putrescine transport system ATPase subunit